MRQYRVVCAGMRVCGKTWVTICLGDVFGCYVAVLIGGQWLMVGVRVYVPPKPTRVHPVEVVAGFVYSNLVHAHTHTHIWPYRVHHTESQIV